MEKFNQAEIANLVVILKIFEGQPHHLAHFLIENNAITLNFRQNLQDSQSILKIKNDGFDYENLHFNNIEEMKNYFESLLNIESSNIEKTIIDFKLKLKEALDSEDYESAIRYRDYIKRISKK